MGAGASVDTLPEVIDQELFKKLAGDLYSDDTFNLCKFTLVDSRSNQ